MVEKICQTKKHERIIVFDFMRIVFTYWIVFFCHIKAYVNSNDFINQTSSDIFFQITYTVLLGFAFISGYLRKC